MAKAKNRQTATKRQTSKSKKRPWLTSLIDSYSLSIALVVELAITMISFWIIAPGIIEGIGFVLIATIVVLFAVRSWMKAMVTVGIEKWVGRSLWVAFAVVALFFNLSFALASTDVQTLTAEVQVSIEEDSALARLDERLDRARERRQTLDKQYDEAVRATTVASLLSQIDAVDAQIAGLEAQINTRELEILSGEATRQARTTSQKLTAERIFNAIPNATSNERWVELIIFFFIFFGLELTIVMAVTDQNTAITKRKQGSVSSREESKIISKLAAVEKELHLLQDSVDRQQRVEGGDVSNASEPGPRTVSADKPKRVKAKTPTQKVDRSKPKWSTSETLSSKVTHIPTRGSTNTALTQERLDTYQTPSLAVAASHMLIDSFIDSLVATKFADVDAAIKEVLKREDVLAELTKSQVTSAAAERMLATAVRRMATYTGPSGYPLMSWSNERYVPNYSADILKGTLKSRLRTKGEESGTKA